MSKASWIIIILITILMISSYWFSRGKDAPPWVKCKESLFEQVVLKKCTLVKCFNMRKLMKTNL